MMPLMTSRATPVRDEAVEEAICRAFVLKRKRGRFRTMIGTRARAGLLMELFIAGEGIDTSLGEPTRHGDVRGIYRELRAAGAPETCYVMDADGEFDGQHVSLLAALESINPPHEPFKEALISCVPGRLAYLQYEAWDTYQLILRAGRGTRN